MLSSSLLLSFCTNKFGKMAAGDSSAAVIVKSLGKASLTQNTEVSFAGRGLKLDKAEDAAEIVKAINDAKTVHSLRLDGNTIGAEASKSIADALKKHPEFERALWSDIYTGRVRSEIPPSLNSLGGALIEAGAKLKELDLSDNAFGPDGVKAIKKLLMSPACYSLETLRLNNNGLGIGGGKILSEALIGCHKASVAAGTPLKLKVFISGRNRLENEGAIALAALFKTLGSLEVIQMPQNGIHHPGITALAESFACNENLKLANLNDNTCGSKGAGSIARVLPELNSLITLNLGDALVRNSGALAIATALKRGATNLEELILYGNEIRQDGAMAIVEAVAHRNNLKVLNLDANQLGESVDDIIEKMDSYGKKDILTSFEENEEPDSEDEDVGEADEEEEEEGERSIDDSADNLALEIKGIGLSPDAKQLKDSDASGTIEDAKEFLENPSLKLYKHLPQKQRKSLILTAMKGYLGNATASGKVFVKATVALKEDKEGLSIVSDAILEDAFKKDEPTQKVLINSILVHMGLLKAEEKVEILRDISGPLIALEHVVRQDYFPRAMASYFVAFMARPDSILDYHKEHRHHLLQRLYQI